MEVLLAVHVLATAMLAGLIWLVQLVHYPLFAFVGPEAFEGYVREHVRRVTWVVAPLMLVEAASAVALLFVAPSPAARGLAVGGAVLLVVVWASTGLLQVPCHRALTAGFCLPTTRRLVATNWLRTLAWTARAGLAAVLPLVAR